MNEENVLLITKKRMKNTNMNEETVLLKPKFIIKNTAKYICEWIGGCIDKALDKRIHKDKEWLAGKT